MSRAANEGPALRWRDGDREIFELLREHRWITSHLLHRLTGRDFSACKRRLGRLAQEGALVRQELYSDGRYRGFSYATAARGRTAARARQWAGDSLHVPREGRKSPLHILHESAISEVAYRLIAEADQAGFDRPFVERRADVLKFRHPTGEGINPDALLVLSRAASDNQSFFFLEVERGRQGDYADGESGRQRKARQYVAYREHRRYEEHLREVGACDVRTLWVMERPSQLVGFLRWLSLTYPYPMFAATTEAECMRDVFGAIWRTANGVDRRAVEASPCRTFAELVG